jgi:uncharacterized Zn-binding protein involved in type VI secretion
MPGIAVVGDVTTGHAGHPPTKMVDSPVSKTKFNGKKPGVVDDPGCYFAPHTLPNGSDPHPNPQGGMTRIVKKGSQKTKVEGWYIARIGDELYDGDIIAKGSDNSFVE